MNDYVIRNEAERQVDASERDAFFKGAKWVLNSIRKEGLRDILKDEIGPGCIVVEKRNDGTPSIVLGPFLGVMNRANAIYRADCGLWHLPSLEELEYIYKNHREVCRRLCENGENYLMTRTYDNNRGFLNPIAFNLATGSYTCIWTISPQEYAARAICVIGLGQ